MGDEKMKVENEKMKIDEEFSHFKLGNDKKMKVEDIRNMRMKLHDSVIQTLSSCTLFWKQPSYLKQYVKYNI